MQQARWIAVVLAAEIDVEVSEMAADCLCAVSGSQMPNSTVVTERSGKEKLLYCCHMVKTVALGIDCRSVDLLERPRTQHRVCQHSALTWIEIPIKTSLTEKKIVSS